MKMAFDARRFYVWLGSLLAVMLVYLLYTRLTHTPPVQSELAETYGPIEDDANAPEQTETIGMVGDVGVGKVRNAKYQTRNEQKQLEREFGFEELLHKSGDEWEIEKPYIKIFRPKFNCYIEADKGKIIVETAAGKTSLKNAALQNNVLIRILPIAESPIGEAVIYLDDVVFISNRSQFSTDGFVEFVSDKARLVGRGMELIYNEAAQRLELLRITELDNLRLKLSSAANFGSRVSGPGPRQPPSATVDQTQTAGGYRCVLSDNVVIDGPDQLVFADIVSINNIFGAAEQGAQSGDRPEQVSPTADRESPEEDANVGPAADDLVTSEVIVKCNGGIVVAPTDSKRIEDFLAAVKADEQQALPPLDMLERPDANGRAVLVAHRMDYDAVSGDAAAAGPLAAKLYVSDFGGEQAAEPNLVPLTVTAAKSGHFSRRTNVISLQGNCFCKMIRHDPAADQQFMLSSPQLRIELQSTQSSAAASIKSISATGREVRLASTKTAGSEFLGGVELKCAKFDYDAKADLFTAAGPGVVKVDNSKAERLQGLGRLSLRRPCYAFVRDFELLQFSPQTNRLVADAREDGLLVDYFPIAEDGSEDHVAVIAGRIQAEAVNVKGRTEIVSLSASNGITYEDADIQFVGSSFNYNGRTSTIRAYGDQSQPCLLNGAMVDGLEYNLQTGEVAARVSGGTLRQ